MNALIAEQDFYRADNSRECPAQMTGSFPEEWIMKSDKQIKLEDNGCVFAGQEALDNHELDLDKKCYCGRPNNIDT